MIMIYVKLDNGAGHINYLYESPTLIVTPTSHNITKDFLGARLELCSISKDTVKDVDQTERRMKSALHITNARSASLLITGSLTR